MYRFLIVDFFATQILPVPKPGYPAKQYAQEVVIRYTDTVYKYPEEFRLMGETAAYFHMSFKVGVIYSWI